MDLLQYQDKFYNITSVRVRVINSSTFVWRLYTSKIVEFVLKLGNFKDRSDITILIRVDYNIFVDNFYELSMYFKTPPSKKLMIPTS